jgi:hypothetical protein
MNRWEKDEGGKKTNLKEVLKDYIDGWSGGIRGHITYFLNPLAFSLVSFLQITPGFHPVSRKCEKK